MTALPGTKSFYDLGTPVLLRSGYIYVFYRSALWRELEVRVKDNKTTYHDVHVERYRQGKAFKNGARKATGQALDDIWLPSQWNNTQQTDLQLCFSEVQLSAARLKRLEQDKGLRKQRCHSPDLRVSQRGLNRRLGSTLGAKFAKEFTGRLVGQTFAGFIFLGLNLYDAWYAWQWGDEAMWGYLLMAGGGAVGVAAGLFTAKPVLGLTPLGWVALIMIVAGAGVAYWLSSNPIEDWMVNGPFGTGSKAATAHLRDPQEAFYRLLGLFAGIRIQVGSATKPVAQRPWPNALELYFTTPTAQQRTNMGYLHRTSYSWAVKAQFRVSDAQGKTWYFPAPSPKTVVLASEAHKQPDFSNREQPFWASE